MNIRLRPAILLAAGLLATRLGADNEIGFIEKFALAPDREAVLGQLIPGTEDYYFFHALHYQNTGQKPKLAAILEQWAQRFPVSERRNILENREALLGYETDPQKTLQYLREKLGLQFPHTQEVRDRKPDLPTQLDPAAIAREVYLRGPLSDEGLGGLSIPELERLVRDKTPLRPAQRRALLGQLNRPDLPGLVDLIADDLKSKESRGFGEFAIHRALLPDQLTRLRELVPQLANNTAYEYAHIRKLAPGADADAEFDPAQREAWLTRLWERVQGLSPAFNSLKAHVLHARLQFDRSRGIYDRARFTEYLKLPRPLPYVSPKYLQESTGGRFHVDVNATFPELELGLPPVGSDEALVREFLLRFSVEDTTWEPWSEWLRDSWVKAVFAEAKITSGAPEPEKWASLLSPAAYQALRDRVDIEFSPANPAFSPVDDAVSLEVTLKNTPKTLVRVYEINTLGYYLSSQKGLDTDLNLDGLVANSEQSHDGDASPFRRVTRKFEFPELKGRRGAWVVEFIGGGKSSRALIRKGRFSLVQRTSPAGELLTVLDESRKPTTNVVAWLDGRKLAPDARDGRITVPFTAKPGRRPIVLATPDGAFASLAHFEHSPENYSLNATFHIEREQLLARREATLAVRPSLLLGNELVSPNLLEDVRIVLVTSTHDDIVSRIEIPVARLDPARVLTHRFRVPDRLAQIEVSLVAQVPVLSKGGQKETLQASAAWELNGIDRSDATYTGHFSRFTDSHAFELLGRNGEPVPDQPIHFRIQRRGFPQPQEIHLRTDERGRVQLGRLDGIEHVIAFTPDNRQVRLDVADFARTWPERLHARAGETVEIPWNLAPTNGAVSLLEMRAGEFVADRSANLSLTNGVLVLAGLEPGDYSLRLRDESDHLLGLRITAADPVGRWLVGPNRSLELRAGRILDVAGVSTASTNLVIRLRNPNAFTRVHVAATRFLPGQDLFNSLSRFTRFEPGMETAARQPNVFTGGRAIGDEYRYILERRYVTRFPGNMLTRPGLILNPWEKRSTDAEALSLARRELAEALQRDRMAAKMDANAAAGMMAMDDRSVTPNLDFLAEAAPVFFNLVPDTNGVVTLPLAALGDRQVVHVYAENVEQAVWGLHCLPEKPTLLRDTRLARNLDPAQPYAESRDVSLLRSGASLTLPDLASGDLEIYDTLASVHGLFATLSKDPTLTKFSWILQWPKLPDAEKRAKYSEFACHELNFFLSRKDPKFFADVVQPYLRNKKDKTFLDEYLLDLDLKRHLEPWNFARLNAAERALLARRLPGESAATARHLRELWELLQPDPEKADRLFETALRGRALADTTPGEPGKPAGSAGERFREEKVRLNAAVQPTSAMAMPPAPGGPAAGGFAGGAPAMAGRRLGMQADKAPANRGAVMLSGAVAADSAPASAEMELAQSLDGVRLDEARAAAAIRIYFRPLGPTKEWAENNYYQLPLDRQGPDLITVNAFWRDFAAWDGTAPFLSVNVAEAHRNFAEMMLALAVLDLPFDAPAHVTKSDTAGFTLTAAGPGIVFQKQFKPAERAGNTTGLLVSESFFRLGDRYREEGNDKFDKFVTEEFLTGTVYGAHLVVGNPGSSPVKLDLLTQVPRGAIPVLRSRPSQSRFVRLDPYATAQFEYHFYFPATPTNGATFAHFPAHASITGRSAGAARPLDFRVVRQLSRVDTASWEYISQQGSDADVFAFLDKANVARLDLEKIAWRSRASADFFRRLVAFLASHHVWSEPNYRYAVVHNDTAALREWLRHRDDFIARCGDWLSSRLLTIDPVERRAFEHLEYSPLVNQRAHRVGPEHRIANPVLRAQYQRFLSILAHKATPDPLDQLGVVYFLFLQDRVEEALARLKAVPADNVPTRIQLDYLRCYAAFYEEKLADARGIAARYASHPVDRWRTLFAEVTAQLDEIEGRTPARSGTGPDRERQQAELAAAEPTFDFKVENRTVSLHWRNLREVTLNFYLMDPEFLFSSSPFVASDASRFSIIKPTFSTVQALPAGRDALDIPLPARFNQANVLVEVLGAGHRRTQAYHASTFRLTLAENYGRLEVRDQGSDKAVPKAYVKVYARLNGGAVRFLKDGYTDLRGRFDYASVNDSGNGRPVPQPRPATAQGLDYPMLAPGELDRVEKIALLVLSDSHGAAVREVDPPRK